MIVSVILTIVLNIMMFVIGLVMYPLRLIFPSMIVSSGDMSGYIAYIANTFKTIQNIFIYFSSPLAFRVLMFALVINFVVVPSIKPTITAIRFLLNWYSGLKP